MGFGVVNSKVLALLSYMLFILVPYEMEKCAPLSCGTSHGSCTYCVCGDVGEGGGFARIHDNRIKSKVKTFITSFNLEFFYLHNITQIHSSVLWD